MKRFLCIILSLCLLLCLAACGAQTPAPTTTAPTTQATTAATTAATEPPTTQVYEESQISPLLYKVTDASGNTAWLFGSIHVGEDYFYPLPGYVLSAYDGADALAVECDVVALSENIFGMSSALTPLIYTDGSTISDHISPELYESSVNAMKTAGIYMSMLDRCKPALWYMLLESWLVLESGADTELGIDMFFLSDAHETGKEIQEIESAEFQYGMLAGFSDELQIMLLESILPMVEDVASYAGEITEMLELWASGDEQAFSDYLNAEEVPEDPAEAALMEEYNEAMITSRNLSMADFAEEALRSGKEVFIVVGAAHVVGEGAMADLLTQRGYTVELITP